MPGMASKNAQLLKSLGFQQVLSCHTVTLIGVDVMLHLHQSLCRLDFYDTWSTNGAVCDCDSKLMSHLPRVWLLKVKYLSAEHIQALATSYN